MMFLLRISSKGTGTKPTLCRVYLKKKSLFTDIGTQRRAPNLVNRILWLFGQQGSG